MFCLLIAAVAVCSCRKSPVENICGSYSFKTGGALELKTRVIDVESGGVLLKDTIIRRNVVPESGQMRIISESGDRVVISMDIFAGDLVVMNAVVNGDDIILDPIDRKVFVFRESGLSVMEGVNVNVSGSGKRLGGSVILDLKYQGSFDLGLYPCTIVSSNVNCVANRNE